MELTIDLKKLKESGLWLEEFLLLALINIEEDVTTYRGRVTDLMSLEENMYIKRTEGRLELRGKGRELFEQKVPIINFDEFWDVFPSSTPKGRPLRAGSKEWGGKPTRDYVVCKKKYLAVVKNIPTHNKIVAVVKARVSTGDYEFMNNMETYINQQKWQQDVKYLKQDKDWTTQRV